MKSLIHSQTSTMQLLKFWNGYLVISSLILMACDYISILGLKLISVNEVAPDGMREGDQNGKSAFWQMQ